MREQPGRGRKHACAPCSEGAPARGDQRRARRRQPGGTWRETSWVAGRRQGDAESHDLLEGPGMLSQEPWKTIKCIKEGDKRFNDQLSGKMEKFHSESMPTESRPETVATCKIIWQQRGEDWPCEEG